MRTLARFAVFIMTVAVVLTMLLADASATRLSVSSQRFRIIWSSLIFETSSRSFRILCPVTLEGSFHSATIVKTLEALVGFITRASIKGEEPPCTGGTATVLSASLPWHISLEAYIGTLPRPSGLIVLLIGPAFQVHGAGSLTCLGRTEARRPTQGVFVLESGGSGRVNSFRPEEGKTIPLTGEGGLCAFAGEGLLKGEEAGTVTTETGASITVRLI